MIKEKFNELKKETIFKKARLGKAELFLVFCITDPSLNIEQIDFSFINAGKLRSEGGKVGKNKENKTKATEIKNFSFKNGIWQFHKTNEEKNFNKIDIENVKDIPEVLPKINELLHDKKLDIDKFIFILESEDYDVYSIICLCKDFFIYKIKMNAKTLKLLDAKLHNAMDFFQMKK